MTVVGLGMMVAIQSAPRSRMCYNSRRLIPLVPYFFREGGGYGRQQWQSG